MLVFLRCYLLWRPSEVAVFIHKTFSLPPTISFFYISNLLYRQKLNSFFLGEGRIFLFTILYKNMCIFFFQWTVSKQRLIQLFDRFSLISTSNLIDFNGGNRPEEKRHRAVRPVRTGDVKSIHPMTVSIWYLYKWYIYSNVLIQTLAVWSHVLVSRPFSMCT